MNNTWTLVAGGAIPSISKTSSERLPDVSPDSSAASLSESEQIVLDAILNNPEFMAKITSDGTTDPNAYSFWREMMTNSFIGTTDVKKRDTLPAGKYYTYIDSKGDVVFNKYSAQVSDEVLDLPGLPTKELFNQIQKFWSKKDAFKKSGFLQKRGILLYGPPGCGKTCILQTLIKQLVDAGGIVLNMSGFIMARRALSAIRRIEPERPVMIVYEDMETILESSNGSNIGEEESAALSFLDGQDQLNHVVHIATTNKPDVLADRFIRRPGRFDLICEINAPRPETRRAYLEAQFKHILSEEKITHIVKETDGLSLGYLREIVVTHTLLDISIEETVARLKDSATRIYKIQSAKRGYSFGFEPEGKKK